MKQIAFLYIVILSLIIFSGCSSSNKYMKKGDYDMVVKVAVKKLLKKHGNEKEILNLEKAYPIAVQEDLDNIKKLKVQGSSDRWEEIYKIYNRLDERQTYVKKVTPINYNGRTITFPFVDYNKDMAESKSKAQEYLYEHAKQLLQKGDRESCRNAHAELIKAKLFDASYRNIDDLIAQAKDCGTSKVFVTIRNFTPVKINNDIKENILKFGSEGLDREWVDYNISINPGNKDYDYSIFVNINYIDVSPEHIKDSRHVEKKKVQDGWEYEYDAKGNVKKDSTGNDIKRPKFVQLSCEVLERLQHKQSKIEGTVEYVDNISKKTLIKEPFVAEHIFEWCVLTANGNLDALPKETRQMLGRQPVPFPSDFDMILAASEQAGHLVRDILRDKRNYLK